MPSSAPVLYAQRNMRGAVNIVKFPFARVIHYQGASDLCRTSVDDVSMVYCGFNTHHDRNYNIHIRLLVEGAPVPLVTVALRPPHWSPCSGVDAQVKLNTPMQ